MHFRTPFSRRCRKNPRELILRTYRGATRAKMESLVVPMFMRYRKWDIAQN
jgi:hypothetical protein